MLDDRDAGGLAGPDRRMQFLDRRLFEAERFFHVCVIGHAAAQAK